MKCKQPIKYNTKDTTQESLTIGWIIAAYILRYSSQRQHFLLVPYLK